MKTAIILVLTSIAVAVVAVHRQGRLTELKEETRMLEQHPAASTSTRPRRNLDIAQPDVSAAQVELVSEAIVELFTARQPRELRDDAEAMERAKGLLLAARELSVQDVEKVMHTLLDDPRLAEIGRDQILEMCSGVMSEATPFSWREYLIANRDLPNWQHLFESATRQCLGTDPRQALALIEREMARGNPEVATTRIRSGMLMALAAHDPDKMLAHAVSPEFLPDPDALYRLGGSAFNALKSTADHQRFLDALRRTREKNPSPVLDRIRKDYVRELSQRLSSWTADEAITLIDSEFTTAERFQFANSFGHIVDHNESEKWLDWFLKIDPDEWGAWSGGDKHPLVRKIESGAFHDAEMTAILLEKIPPGPVRDEATLSYAWVIADRDPDRAASYLDQLPESDGKQNLTRKIEQARR